MATRNKMLREENFMDIPLASSIGVLEKQEFEKPGSSFQGRIRGPMAGFFFLGIGAVFVEDSEFILMISLCRNGQFSSMSLGTSKWKKTCVLFAREARKNDFGDCLS
jgi:hypothetical protein